MPEKLKPEKKKLSVWGNSCGLRLSQNILNAASLRTGDEVMISVEDNRIIITPAKHRKKITKEEKINRVIELLNELKEDIKK